MPGLRTSRLVCSLIALMGEMRRALRAGESDARTVTMVQRSTLTRIGVIE